MHASIVGLIVTFNLISGNAQAVQGRVFPYLSPYGIEEACIITAHLPGSNELYSKKDIEREQALCSLDFYKIPLCPKTWSTSPATVLAKPVQNISIATYETAKCTKASIGKKYGKFKVSMNQDDTSGTYSKSPLVYYHLSRYLNTVVGVPVAVYRTMDRKTHLERVSSKAKGQGGMNIAGWKHLVNAEKNPSSYIPVEDLFTLDLKTIYGTITKDTGDRYGAEFNSPRKAAWGLHKVLNFKQQQLLLPSKRRDHSTMLSLLENDQPVKTR